MTATDFMLKTHQPSQLCAITGDIKATVTGHSMYWTNSEAFTSKQKENHEIRGRLELCDILLPLSIDSLSHHLQETLHQAGLHQLQLYHIW